jgi:hypothetical protein
MLRVSCPQEIDGFAHRAGRDTPFRELQPTLTKGKDRGPRTAGSMLPCFVSQPQRAALVLAFQHANIERVHFAMVADALALHVQSHHIGAYWCYEFGG